MVAAWDNFPKSQCVCVCVFCSGCVLSWMVSQGARGVHAMSTSIHSLRVWVVKADRRSRSKQRSSQYCVVSWCSAHTPHTLSWSDSQIIAAQKAFRRSVWPQTLSSLTQNQSAQATGTDKEAVITWACVCRENTVHLRRKQLTGLAPRLRWKKGRTEERRYNEGLTCILRHILVWK